VASNRLFWSYFKEPLLLHFHLNSENQMSFKLNDVSSLLSSPFFSVLLAHSFSTFLDSSDPKVTPNHFGGSSMHVSKSF